MVRIAVVIPAFNRQAVIGRAIESVRRQELTDFELVVVDDGSTDGTADRVAAIDDARLTLVRLPCNAGGNAARNRGIVATTAPLIAFLDSDDEFLPDKLSTVVERFDREPDLDALLDSYTVINPNKHGGAPIDRINPVIETSADFLTALFDSSVKARRLRKSASGITVRRATAVRAGLFDEAIRRRQDTDFLIRLAKTGRCAATDRKLWIKHDLSDGITATSDGYMAATIEICRRNPEYLTDPRLRSGLARDVARNLWQTARSRGAAALAQDVRLLVAAFGAARVAKLLGRAAVVLAADPFSAKAAVPKSASDRSPATPGGSA